MLVHGFAASICMPDRTYIYSGPVQTEYALREWAINYPGHYAIVWLLFPYRQWQKELYTRMGLTPSAVWESWPMFVCIQKPKSITNPLFFQKRTTT